MHAPSLEAGNKPTARLATCVVLLWLAGNGLRLTILAVPPLIPLIHDDLRMSETQVGLLAGLPVFLFALAAVPGSLLTARFGALAAVLFGLVVTAAGSALRAIVPGVAALYAATFVTGFGVAVMQPAMPPLVRAWLPTRIGLGTAIYANGLLIGEILPVSLMQPLVLPAVGGSWRLALAVWAVPCLVIAAIILFAAPRAPRPGGDTRPRWWPQWNSGTLWRLGFMLGGVNAAYFTTNHFLPDYLTQSGRGDLVANALIALNTGQLPGSLLLLALAGRLERRPAVYAAFGAITFAAVTGIIFGNGTIIVLSSGLIGFATASVLILLLALPPLISRQEDVPRMAAGMFTISYSCAVLVPVLSGFAWDITGAPAAAFAPIGIGALLMIILSPVVRTSSRCQVPITE